MSEAMLAWSWRRCGRTTSLSGSASSRCRPTPALIAASIHHEYSGSIQITTHLDFISHCKTASGTNWSSGWTYRVFMIHTRRDELLPAALLPAELAFLTPRTPTLLHWRRAENVRTLAMLVGSPHFSVKRCTRALPRRTHRAWLSVNPKPSTLNPKP